MNRDDILKMPASREIDARIESIIFRHSPYQGAFDIWRVDIRDVTGRVLPKYTTDIAAAWSIVEKLMNDGFIYSSGGNDVCGNLVFSATFVKDLDGGENVDVYYSGITEHNLPLAICRAALLAVMELK